MTTASPVLWIFVPEAPGRAYALRPDSTLGRDDNNAIVIDHRSVSRLHARVRQHAGGWQLIDLGSKNGLRVGGVRVARCELLDGEWLAIGDVYAQFQAHAVDDLQAMSARRAASATLRLGLRNVARAALLERACEAFVATAECQRGLLLIGADGEAVVRAATARASADSGSRTLIDRAMAENRSILISDIASEAWVGERPSVVAQNIAAAVCFPLRAAGQVIGALYADSTAIGKRFTELDAELLQAVADDAALLISEARLAAQLDDAYSEMLSGR
mgnify:CR=1 FL=1